MSGFEVSAAITTAPGLFLACVECFELIQLGRSFGKDFERSLLRLQVTKLRFVRIGSCMGIMLDNPEAILPERISEEVDIDNAAKGLMSSIMVQFTRTSGICKQYTGDDKSVREVEDVKDENILTLLQKVRDQAKNRQSRTSLTKKVAWACYEKKRLDTMLNNIKDDIDELSSLLKTQDREVQRATQEVNTIKAGTEVPGTLLSILKEVADGTDAALGVAADDALENGGHRYQENYLEKCDNVTYGNWIGTGATASTGGGSHTYAGNRAHEVKNAVYGNYFQGNAGT